MPTPASTSLFTYKKRRDYTSAYQIVLIHVTMIAHLKCELCESFVEVNSNITGIQNNKLDKTQLTGNGTTIRTICLYKNSNDGKLYLQVNWNNGISYILVDQTADASIKLF